MPDAVTVDISAQERGRNYKWDPYLSYLLTVCCAGFLFIKNFAYWVVVAMNSVQFYSVDLLLSANTSMLQLSVSFRFLNKSPNSSTLEFGKPRVELRSWLSRRVSQNKNVRLCSNASNTVQHITMLRKLKSIIKTQLHKWWLWRMMTMNSKSYSFI